LNFKYKISSFWLLAFGALVLLSCEESADPGEYEPGLVVFGNLNAYAPVIDTFFVSWSYSIEDSHETGGGWIDSAEVFLFTDEDTISLSAVEGRPGRYVDSTDYSIPYFIEPGMTYHLEVIVGDKKVTSSTTVPEPLSLTSPDAVWWPCEGDSFLVDGISLNLENEQNIVYALLSNNLELLLEPAYEDFDTVVYIEGPCYTTYFGSVPLFIVEWEAEVEPGMVRVISLAVEDTVSNAIVDTSFNALSFKGPMHVDEDGNYYRPNPVVWNLSYQQPMLDIGWLFFNYTGLHLIAVQATDEAFSDYFEGDPLQFNPYIPPYSNIEGGYGLFSSVSTRLFLVNVIPDSTAETP